MIVRFKDGREEKATMQKNGYLLFEDGTELNQYELEALKGTIVSSETAWEITVTNKKEVYGNRESRTIINKFSINFRDENKKIIFKWALKTNTVKDLRKIVDKSFKIYE